MAPMKAIIARRPWLKDQTKMGESEEIIASRKSDALFWESMLSRTQFRIPCGT